MELECIVGFSAGANTTNTVRGEKASSTESAERAAEVLGRKLFGPSLAGVAAKGVTTRRGQLHDVFTLIVDDPCFAFCWQSGLIQTGADVPEGAIAFARGPERALAERLAVLARHGQGASAGKLLVPGVPEADTDEKKLDALISWVEWCEKRNGPRSFGVVFSRDGDQLIRSVG